MPIEDLQGAWRIEEARGWTGKEHKYAKPNTHWLILGNHGIPMIQTPPDPFYFEFRITLDEETHPQTFGVIGPHGGSGFFELTDELLLVTIGGGGIKPPRFEFGCGNYFAFTRDHGIELPQPPTWSRKAITSQRLGEIIWNPTDKRWTGSVELPDGNECEIWAVDDLMPIAIFLSKLELVH